jgi:hypothetical protein
MLDFQVAFKSNARGRAEQMVSYLLTTIAAILDAVLLIVQGGENYLLISLTAALLIWMFSAFSFYRVCRLRNAITHARLNRRYIRSALEQAGLTPAASIIAIEGQPSGFSWRIVLNLNVIGAISSLAAGLSVALFWALFQPDLALFPSLTGDRPYLNYVLLALVGFLGTMIVLVRVYRSYYFNSERMIAKILPGTEGQPI